MPEDEQKVGRQGNGQTVVVGVDGSEHSRLALKWAADEAQRREAFLKIVYAQTEEPQNVPAWYASDTTELAPADAIIDDATGLVATRHPSVAARGEVVDWPAALVLTIASRSAELIVVGARGKGGFEGLRLGSVSDQCVQYAHCPVVVVHSDSDDLPYRAVDARIVVGIDGSPGSTRALRWALDEAQFRSASVEAVFARQHPPLYAVGMGPTRGSEGAARDVADAATELAKQRAPEVAFEVADSVGTTVPVLLEACGGADLLVVGSRGHGGFEDALLGSVAHQCARHASCAVVVARPSIVETDTDTTAQVDRRAERTRGHDKPEVPVASAPARS